MKAKLMKIVQTRHTLFVLLENALRRINPALKLLSANLSIKNMNVSVVCAQKISLISISQEKMEQFWLVNERRLLMILFKL